MTRYLASFWSKPFVREMQEITAHSHRNSDCIYWSNSVWIPFDVFREISPWLSDNTAIVAWNDSMLSNQPVSNQTIPDCPHSQSSSLKELCLSKEALSNSVTFADELHPQGRSQRGNQKGSDVMCWADLRNHQRRDVQNELLRSTGPSWRQEWVRKPSARYRVHITRQHSLPMVYISRGR